MKRHSLLLLLSLSAGTLLSQITGDYREMFLEAESYFLFEEYLDALPYYEPIHKQYPDNDNINYKIGVCYLNDPYRKSESIEYLEKASENIALKYKDNSFRETQAPLEAIFYLGNAYRINGQLDKAIETYERFKTLADPDLYDLELVDEQITACENAKELETRPVDFDISNLGDRVNTRFSDVNPVISGDETKLVYIQKQPFYDAVAYCEKLEDGWSFPRILMEELHVDEDAYPTDLNYDGTEMILYRSDNFIGDLYTSKLVNGFWTPPVRMNDNINTKYWESHGCFSRTGDTLYFTSNRKGGYGGLDIYFSIRNKAGEWGVPVNVGPVINTRYNEETPFITADGKTLYFSSYGHYNMGGYDVFYSTLLDNGEWSVPTNAGYPINTTDDDLFFNPVRNGTFAYFPRLLDGGNGLIDIYRYEIYSTTHPRKFLVKGILGIRKLEQLTRPVRIVVLDQQRDTVAMAIADSRTGEFNFSVPVGKYEMHIEGEDIEPAVSSLVIPEGYREKEFKLTREILLTQAGKPEELTIQEDIRVKDTLLYVSTGDTVRIDLTLERRANLYVNVVQGGEQVRRDSFRIERRRFTYPYLPVPGENLLKFELIDRHGNVSYKDVRIIYTPGPEVTGENVSEHPVEEETVKTSPGMKQQAETEAGLQDYLNRLTANSTGGLKTFLSGIDLAALGITTAEQLDNYLRDQAGKQGYTKEEVDRLLLVTPVSEKESTELLRQNLAASSKGNLQRVLMELDLDAEGIRTGEELIQYLREHADEYGVTSQDINDLIISDMQKEYLKGYRDQLRNLTENEALRNALDETDLAEIGSLQELYEHLLSESERYGYTAKDVNSLFSHLSQNEELMELIDNLLPISSGDLKTVLKDLDPGHEGIRNPVQLMDYLMNEAENHDYSREDAVRLLLEYLEKEDLQEIIKLLIGTSSGDLLNLLLNLDPGANNIRSLEDLYRYLVEQSRYHDFTEEEVVRMFLNLLKILEYEPIVEVIQPAETPVPEPVHTRNRVFYIMGGLALILLVILFTRKRKKDKGGDRA
jgi:hypothetical protein